MFGLMVSVVIGIYRSSGDTHTYSRWHLVRVVRGPRGGAGWWTIGSGGVLTDVLCCYGDDVTLNRPWWKRYVGVSGDWSAHLNVKHTMGTKQTPHVGSVLPGMFSPTLHCTIVSLSVNIYSFMFHCTTKLYLHLYKLVIVLFIYRLYHKSDTEPPFIFQLLAKEK